jgi:glycerophosphoryl diester phosphodiesterase
MTLNKKKHLAFVAVAVLALLAWPGPAPSAGPEYLIAHRGGIVDERFAENSPGAVKAAIERGYWMIETDIWESKDGRLVVQHDPSFRRFFNENRPVTEMTWSEIERLKANPGGTRPMQFHELTALCRGKISLMLDVKGASHSKQFYESMEKSLRETGLLKTTYVLGSSESKTFFRGKAFLSIDRKALRAAAQRGENVASLYFLMELGSQLDQETVEMANKLGVTVVGALNQFRYEMAKQDHLLGAQQDILKLRKLGVRYFQIDSIYDQWLLPSSAGR